VLERWQTEKDTLIWRAPFGAKPPPSSLAADCWLSLFTVHPVLLCVYQIQYTSYLIHTIVSPHAPSSYLVPRATTSRAHSYHYLTSLVMSLPEGAFPRLNASMVHSGAYTGSIASVVGKAISFDGEQTVELECVDGGRVQIITSPDFSFVPGMIVEIMGAVQEDKTVQVSIPFPRRFRLCW
jgi:hypothetical protein